MRIIAVIAALAGVASGFVPRSSSTRIVSSTSYAPTTNVIARQAQVVHSSSMQRSASSSITALRESPSESTSEPITTTTNTGAPKPPSDWQSQILTALSAIIDPDLNSDIVTLGFVQNLQVDDSNGVNLDLELAIPGSAFKDSLVQQCKDLINGLDWTRGTEVSATAQPANDAPTGAPLGMQGIGAVIAVSSCKGGVGKSTTAVNLAFALEGMGARVGIFDADVYGPSLPTMVTPEDDMVRFVGRQITPLKRGNVSLMSFGYVNEGSAIMRGPMVTQLLDQFLSLTNWGQLDYLIMDMPPGTGDIQLTLSQQLNITAAVIVTTPQELSFVDVERGVEMFDTVNVPCVAVVENMAYYEKEESKVEIDAASLKEQFLEALQKDGAVSDATAAANVVGDLVKIVQDSVQNQNNNGKTEEIRIFGPGHKHRLSEQWGIEHTYSIPLLGKIAEQGDSGTPFILDNPNAPQSDIYRQLARSVVTEVAKTKLGKGKGGGRPGIIYNSDAHIIEVVENDGSGSGSSDQEVVPDTISTGDLRRACRCAMCVEEMTGKQLLNPESVPETIRPLSMSPTGNYALSVDWSDGHKSLYPYRQIRSMLEDRKEEEEKAGLDSVKEKVVL